MPFENLLGLPLPLARNLLAEEPVVVLSAPPFFARGYTAHFGENRVVRARELAGGRLELLVARELIGETRAPNDSKSRPKNPAPEDAQDDGGKESAGR